MKQRITIEQINELTDEQKQKLREWWCPLTTEFNPVGDLTKDQRKRLWDWRELKLGEHFAKWEPYNSAFEEKQNFHSEDDDFYDMYPFTISELDLPLLSIGRMIEFLNGKDVNYRAIIGNNDFTDELCNVLWGAVKIAL